MEINKFNFAHIIYVSTLNKSNKARLQGPYKFKYNYKNSILIQEGKEKKLKEKSNFSIRNKKYYACGKINHFIRDCQLKNFINKNKTFINIIQQFNVIKKEYFIKILNQESRF